MMQYYKVAGLTFCMDSFGITEERAARYRCAPVGKPDFTLVSNWPKIKEQLPQIPDDMGEYLATGVIFYRHLLDYNGMMLHSSAVVADGKAYLFTADCGTGKSTHTKLWLEHLGDRAYILNDDKPALRMEDGRWYAYGTPWSGKHDINVDQRVPLAGIALLRRGENNVITPCGGVAAISRIFKQVNRPKEAHCREKLLELLDHLFQDVPIWDLQCNMDIQAAQVAYEAMSGEETKQ